MSLKESKANMQRYTKEAISLAMQGRWPETVAINKAILELSPEDIDAYNRLGRALMELGEYNDATESYSHTLKLDPYNSIARKNLDRLSHLIKLSPAPKGERKLSLDIFIGEAGKVGVVKLINLAPNEIIARMAPGEEVSLQIEGQRLIVKDENDEYLGEVEPQYGLRLTKMISSGNKYVAAISSLGENNVKVIIREVYQHPSQAGRLSFPQKDKENFRSYARRELIRRRVDEEDAVEEVDDVIGIGDEDEGYTVVDLYEVPIFDDEQREPMLSEEDGNRNSKTS